MVVVLVVVEGVVVVVIEVGVVAVRLNLEMRASEQLRWVPRAVPIRSTFAREKV